MTTEPTGRRLRAYLASAGWSLLREAATGTVWGLGGVRSVLVPGADLDPDDRREILGRAVARVADVESRGREEVLRDIALVDRDTLLLKIESPDISHGEVSLRFGSDAFQGARELFTAAALTEHAPRARYGSFRPPEVLDVLDTTTFGLTHAGSYVITIRTRGAIQLSLAPEDQAAPLDRRSVARVLAGATAASAAPIGTEIESSVSAGVSYEMCSAISKLDPGGTGAAVELSAIWAPGIPRPKSAPDRAVRLEDAELSHIREVRDYLAAFEPVEIDLVGGLTDVHVDLGGVTGRIKLEALVEGRIRPVHVELEGEALERVRGLVGRASLRLKGRLEKDNRSWVLATPKLVAVDELADAVD